MTARVEAAWYDEFDPPFDGIRIDPRCAGLIAEFKLYTYPSPPAAPPPHLVRGRASTSMIRIDVRRLKAARRCWFCLRPMPAGAMVCGCMIKV